MVHPPIRHAVLVVALASPLVSFADRPQESRDKATHVAIGRVEGVYAQEGATGANQRCVVEIAVEKVERGGGLKAGTALYASIYRPNPKAPDLKKMTEREQKRYLLTVDGGHDAAPRPGTRVRVFLIHSAGTYTGVFPRWVDVLKEHPPDR
jgi:hypothetical protein